MSGISDEDQAAAEAVALQCFEAAAERYREHLYETWREALPGNHSRVDAVMLAQLLTGHDGYNGFTFSSEWSKRLRDGWQTSFSYLAQVGPRLTVDFALESRYEQHARQLAIFIDDHRPGERTPEKQRREQLAAAQGCRVLVLTDQEVLGDPEACLERVESIAFDMIEDAMIDAGVLTAPPSRPGPAKPQNDN